jgi:hypothetical protein
VKLASGEGNGNGSSNGKVVRGTGAMDVRGVNISGRRGGCQEMWRKEDVINV